MNQDRQDMHTATDTTPLRGPIVIIGGGIGGLVCAHEIRRLAGDAVEVLVLEATDRPGGLIYSEAVDGYRVEWATNGFLDNAPRTLELVERLDLADEVEPSSEKAARRYLYRGGRLHELPTRPLAFLRSPMLSVRGRLRVALEPFAAGPPAGDETVHDFASRRIGEEAARVLVDAMVSGIFAGDTRRLSVASAFPLLKQIEQEHGGLIRGMIAKQKAARRARRAGEAAPEVGAGPGGRLTSFRNGMETLPGRLAELLGDRLRLGTPVTSVARLPAIDDASPSLPFRITTAHASRSDGVGPTLDAATIVLAIPSWTAADLVRSLSPALADELAAIDGAPLAVVALGFDEQEFGGAPDGFGFLIPSSEGLQTLGCLWDSSIFRFRAAAGTVLLRAMIGGARHPDAAGLDDETLLATVQRDLATTMGLTATPRFVRIIRHPHGIAQYPPGHGARLDRIDAHLAALDGLFVTGFSYRGVAVNRLVEDAQAIAHRVLVRHGVVLDG